MKKLLTIAIALVVFSVAALPTFAQGRRRCYQTYGNQSPVYNQRSYYDYGNQRSYYDYGYRDRSFWDKHRDKLSVGIGTGAGALLGALIGGNKGAAIGALAGAGGSALYTYKLRSRNNNNYYYRR